MVAVSRAASTTATARPTPDPTPVTRPVRSTVTTVGSSVAQPGVLFGATTRKPRLSNALAVRDCWSPSAVMGGTGSGEITTRFACCATVTVRLSSTAPLWARIRTVPLSTARTRPPVVTVAMLGAELVQLTGTDGMTLSRASRAVATMVDSAVRALSSSALGDNRKWARRCATSTLAVPVSLSTTARSTAWPFPRATRRPGATSAATVVSDELQVGDTPGIGLPYASRATALRAKVSCRLVSVSARGTTVTEPTTTSSVSLTDGAGSGIKGLTREAVRRVRPRRRATRESPPAVRPTIVESSMV